MNESILSQEEIDALLKDSDEPTGNESIFSDIDEVEKDAIGEIANISMGTAATTLSSLLNKKVEITTPKVELTNKLKLRSDYPKPYVIVNVSYTNGLEGNNILVINMEDASIIVDLMMGGVGSNLTTELSEIHLSAIGEAMNQMMGSSATSMSTVLDKRIDISPPTTDVVDLTQEDVGFESIKDDETIIKISFKMVIQGLSDSELIQLIPIEFGKNMVKDLFASLEANSQMIEEQAEITSEISEDTKEEYPEIKHKEELSPSQTLVEPKVKVKPVNFSQLQPLTSEQKAPENLDLILDVPLQISVELGRTNKTIKDILNFSQGSIVELDKLAGEPVDMLVNGKLFAKGEVVVIDENFGVRITDIVSPMDRIKNLQ
jgi:flagellar motor switch protein FliN/FliY